MKRKNIWALHMDECVKGYRGQRKAETAMLIADWKDEGIVKEEISFLANSVRMLLVLFTPSCKLPFLWKMMPLLEGIK